MYVMISSISNPSVSFIYGETNGWKEEEGLHSIFRRGSSEDMLQRMETTVR